MHGGWGRLGTFVCLPPPCNQSDRDRSEPQLAAPGGLPLLPLSCGGTTWSRPRGGGAGSTAGPCVFLQLSHDANETLPLHLYVKSYGKNVDSKLQGRWGGPRGWPGAGSR